MKVRLVDSDYWAEAVNFGHKFLHVPTQYVRDYERLLMGGIWAQVDMRFEYDEESKGKNPFWIDKLTPIQIATFDLEEYRQRPARVHDRRVDRPDGPEHGLRARRDVAAAEAAVPRPADPACRAELQPRRARPARHRQELRRPGGLAVRRAADRRRRRSPTCSAT